jgi:hypothetical protein
VTANADGTQLSLKTPADSPSRNVVVVCGISGCSAGGRGDTFTYFQPGDPVVTGIKPLHGPRGGKVEITGTNLGFVRKVLFGGVPGKAIGNPFQSLDQGDPDHVVAKAPAGKIGTTVPVRVATLESEVEHPADPLTPVNSAITYTYRKANTQVGLTLTPNPPVAGQADKITAGVAVPRGSTRAVGRVQFSDNGAVFATRPLPPSDQITVKHRFTAGRHTVTATFLGTRTLLRSHLTKKVLAAH